MIATEKQRDYLGYLEDQCIVWLKQAGIEWTPERAWSYEHISGTQANVMIQHYKGFNDALEITLEKSTKVKFNGNRLKEYYRNFPCFWEDEPKAATLKQAGYISSLLEDYIEIIGTLIPDMDDGDFTAGGVMLRKSTTLTTSEADMIIKGLQMICADLYWLYAIRKNIKLPANTQNMFAEKSVQNLILNWRIKLLGYIKMPQEAQLMELATKG